MGQAFQPVILFGKKSYKGNQELSEDKGGRIPSEPFEANGFQPINPWRSAERGETKTHLPHLQTPQATYFVTFRCREGLSLPDKARDIVMSAIRYWDGLRIELDAAVVMPDHVHLIVWVLDGLPLGVILKSIKGFSARAINRMLASHGSLWLDESFDHIIRHEREWDEKVMYIRDNPCKKWDCEDLAGLPMAMDQRMTGWKACPTQPVRLSRQFGHVTNVYKLQSRAGTPAPLNMTAGWNPR